MGGSTSAPVGQLEHRLAGAIARVQLLQAHAEAVAGIADDQPQVLGLADQHARQSARHRADRAGPTAARPGRAPRAAYAPAGCRRPVLSMNTASCVLRPRAAAWKASPVLYDRLRGSMSWPLAERTKPPVGQHHGHRLVRQQFAFLDRLRRGALDDARAPLIAVFPASAVDLGAHQLPQLGLAAEQLLELARSSRQRLLLLADLHLLELRQVAQLGLEDRLGLLIRQLEALDQHRLGFILAPDDADHLIEVQVGDQQSIEDVQPRETLSRRCCSRRRTVCWRNSSHSASSALSPMTRGRPSVAMTFRLTR
jgi:hypothetical protein